MEDAQVLDRIEDLVEEEHRLLDQAETEHRLDAKGHTRLEEIKVSLDRCWDLMHQRRGLRSAGRDPDEASVRDAETVENYEG